MKYNPNNLVNMMLKRKKLHLCRITALLGFLDSQEFTDQNYNYKAFLLKLIENFMIFC